jgi:imidazolonepropionase-like amidohydrolase
MPFPRSRNLLLAAMLTSASAAQASSEGAALALDQVRIVDVEQASVGPPRCVRVEGARILRIAAAGSRACRRGARVQDAAGRFLLPGFIDMHAHLTMGPMVFQSDQGRTALAVPRDDGIAAHNAPRLVAFGVTTIRNPGGDLAAAAHYEAERAAGRLVGPESFDAGPVIDASAVPGIAEQVRTEAEMRATVDRQVDAGAEWIKLYAGLSPALLKAGIDAAHARGRPAVAHLDRVSWPEALAMGLDGIVHLMPVSGDALAPEERAEWQRDARPGGFIFFEWWEHFDPDGPEADRIVAAFDRHRPVFDATLVAFHAAYVQDAAANPYKDDARRYAYPPLLEVWNRWLTLAAGWKPEDFRRARAVWPKIERMAQRLYATRARLTLGTDMDNPWIAPGISLHREMDLLAEAGVPVPRILAAATRNAAEALGAGERLGRVAVGYEADLVLLDGNPLSDLRHTRDIHAVLLDGRYLDAARLSLLKGDSP